jgi:hypothetical protein
MLRQPLLQHISEAAAADSMAGAVLSGGAGRGASSAAQNNGAAPKLNHITERKQQWQRLLGMSVSGRKTWQLVDMLATVQQSPSGADPNLMDDSKLVRTLQKHGLWPVVADHDPDKLLSACLVCALDNLPK